MFDALLGWSNLPNLHHALVHFPIAMVPVAIGFDLIVLLGRRPGWDRATALLYSLAAAGAGAAVWAGEEAADSLSNLDPLVRPDVAAHSDWAHGFLYAILAVAAGRLLLTWADRRAARAGLRRWRALVLAGALGSLVLLLGAADRGGGLVYRSGVAVVAVPSPPRDR